MNDRLAYILAVCLVSQIAMTAPQVYSAPSVVTLLQQEEPAYAKWGKLAVEKVKERYPDYKVVDYLHIGREEGEEDNQATEKFKLWLRDDGECEFGVFINITFDLKTEEVIEITYEKTDR
ncbi:DUF3889 domain-containing protein [Alteribacter populi]|uniref:DUF3889 domain-containing protein n=1 Tax=Alteribacter populi TaxID=2011011 RepID=UPI001FE0643B|nr:DUF3889 domain-containing protein [Alteribacter populi]